jgi:hypothetical protein
MEVIHIFFSDCAADLESNGVAGTLFEFFNHGGTLRVEREMFVVEVSAGLQG